MTSTIKVDNIQNQCGANIINESSNTITIGASGDTVSLASGASQTGFGRTGTVDWETTPKTSDFTAVSGDGFFVNTTSGTITATLPAGAAGAIVSFADYAGTWQTNTLTVSPNGSDKIGGTNGSVYLNTEGQSVSFVYVDSTQGWVNVQDSTSNVRANPFIVATGGTVTTCGDFKTHTFTSPGTFAVTNIASCASQNIMSHLVVAGGGGGTAGNPGGGAGGGAGGFREVKNPVTPYTASPLDGYPSAPNRFVLTVQSYPVTVGGGGAGGDQSSPVPGRTGTAGSNSSVGSITSAGGGGAKFNNCFSGDGGSGGGSTHPTISAGSGNTPPVSPAQGNDGGVGAPGSSGKDAGGGGGGATAAGTAGSNPGPGGPGGAGATTNISGSPTAYAGGGGGGKRNCTPDGTAGSGGTGGGGAGALGSASAGGNGTANTGGGAGGGSYSGGSQTNGGTGGSGIVIIKYKFQ